MKLYLVHCGFYDPIAGDGIYELHTNLFVVAESFTQAKSQVKLIPEYQQKKMHVDGMQEITQVQGYPIQFGQKQGDKTQVQVKRSTFSG